MRMKAEMIDVVRWAYRDELVKKAGAGLGYPEPGTAVERYGETGISSFSMRGPVSAEGPHGDALLIARMVEGLPRLAAVTEGGGNEEVALALKACLGPMAGIVPRAAAEAAIRLPMATAGRIVSVALGVVKAPGPEVWLAEPLRDDRGSVVECDVRKRRVSMRFGKVRSQITEYLSGYCPLRYDPDPLGVLKDRIEWAVTVEALALLAEACSDRLERWTITGVGLPAMPWRGDVRNAAARRVLADLGAGKERSQKGA